MWEKHENMDIALWLVSEKESNYINMEKKHRCKTRKKENIDIEKRKHKYTHGNEPPT
jgi:hypothetical protein